MIYRSTKCKLETFATRVSGKVTVRKAGVIWKMGGLILPVLTMLSKSKTCSRQLPLTVDGCGPLKVWTWVFITSIGKVEVYHNDAYKVSIF